MSLLQAFENFTNSAEYHVAFDSATKASWSGPGYSVELFPDGTFRVLSDNDIGKFYYTPGLILSIPTLTDEEWDDDPDLRFYDNAEKELEENFKYSVTAANKCV